MSSFAEDRTEIINYIKGSDTKLAANAAVEEVFRVLKHHGLASTVIEVPYGEAMLKLNLNRYGKTKTQYLPDKMRNEKNYNRALKTYNTKKKVLDKFVEEMKKGEKEQLVYKKTTYYKHARANVQKAFHSQRSYYTPSFKKDDAPWFYSPHSNLTTYSHSHASRKQHTKWSNWYDAYCHPRLQHPDNSKTGSWVEKKPIYLLGDFYTKNWTHVTVSTDNEDTAGLVLSACLRLLLSLEPEIYQDLTDVRDHYTASTMLGVADIAFEETEEDEQEETIQALPKMEN